jgi:hypothetical protein
MAQTNGARRQDVRSRISASLSRITRRAAFLTALLLLSVVGLGIVLLSPIFLVQLAGLTTADWSRLSEIGQTYGAVSALLAAVAVGGVAVSLLFQARQTRIAELQAHRQYHMELMRMELDNVPLYLPCWGPLDIPTLRGKQQHIYTNLIMNFQSMSYSIRSASESDMRGTLFNIFQGEVGRRYWHHVRPYWRSWAELEPRSRRFFRLVDEEYDRAVAAGPPTASDEIVEVKEIEEVQPPALMQPQRAWVRATSVAFASGLLAGIALRRWRLPGENGRRRRPPAGRS